jgi:hypothetical protein
MPTANTWTRGQGEDGTFTHDIRDSAGAVIGATAYTGSEVLTALLWQGGQTAPIVGALVSQWHSPFDGTIDTTVVGAATAAMEPGFYRVEIKLTSGALTVPVYWGWLDLRPEPGTVALGPTYGTFGDVIETGGDWARGLIADFGVSNFQRELERARSWLDRAILARYRVLSYSYTPGAILLYGYWPWGPPEAQNATMAGYLASNSLVVTDQTRELIAHKTLALVCAKKVDFADQREEYRKRANYHNAMANKLLSAYKAELDINADGMTDLAFNMGVVSLR